MSFPVRLSEVTIDWLNAVFAVRGLLGARRIVAFEPSAVSGQGGTSVVHVLTLTYDQPAEQAPKKVLIKFSSENPSVREAVRAHRLYQREIAFYSRYGQDPGIPTSACYAAEYDEETNTCVLLLEYLEEARSRDVYEGGPTDIEQAVRCLAPFHAKWWGRATALCDIEGEYDVPALELRRKKVARAFKRLQDGGYRGACSETCFALLEGWLARAQPLAEYARSRPLTLCHGSFHRGQLLFPERGNGLPWVIDWQNASINVGAHDLARLIVSGLLPDQRRQSERSLISLYHKLLQEHGVRDYPLTELENDYRLGLLHVVVFHSLILADYPVEVISRHWPGKDSFWEVLFHWPGAAVEEWEALHWLQETICPKAEGH